MRVLFLLFIFILSGCHRDGWEHTAIRNGNSACDMARLSHPPTSINDGLELELTRYGKEIHGYINVHTFELPSSEENAHATTLTISTNHASKTFVIPLLEGGQRAHLTDTCLEYLLQTLELKTSVTLSSGHFSETLDASNFQRHYDALVREPSRLRPQNIINFEIY